MPHEIERKFLVISDAWRADVASAEPMRQGYLSTADEATVRVRVQGDRATMTIKGRRYERSAREVEFPVPMHAAVELLDHLCKRPIIEKTRHIVPAGALTWEIDVFAGENDGLIVAEVELPSADTPVPLPEWVGDEVSDDPRYANANLVLRPYSSW